MTTIVRPWALSNAVGPVSSRPGLALAALLIAALLFGGGGAEGPINNGLIEAASAVMLLMLVAGHFTGARPLPQSASVPLLLLIALLCIIGAQLIPLPPAVWHELPGRELPRSALRLIGQENSWRPLSLDPEATRRFGASLFPPAALLIGTLGATCKEASILIKIVVLTAVLGGLAGALQIGLDYPVWLTFYDGSNPGQAAGFFANTNHHASLLLIAVLLVGVWVREAKSERETGVGPNLPFHPAWVGIPFLVILVVATGSRAGIGLLVLAITMAVGIALGLRKLTLAFLTLAAIAGAGLIFLSFTSSASASMSGIQEVLSRDPRFSYFPDIIYGIRQFWPWGAGAGTFAATFVTYENLDALQPATLNHAHNEYLEWLTDFGAPGAFWLTAAGATLTWQAIRLMRARAGARGTETRALAGLCSLFLLASHSAVDYPIRTDAIGAVLGLCVGLIFGPLPRERIATKSRNTGRVALIAAAVVGCILGAQLLRMRAAEAAVRTKLPALQIRMQNGDVLAIAADQSLRANRLDQARSLAAQAIDRSPLSQGAVRTFAAASTLDRRGGTESWQVAAAMGWRDRATQLWAMHQAFEGGQFATAAARADALLRIDQRAEFQAIIRSWGNSPAFRNAFLQRLEHHPSWRNSFFTVPAKPSEAEFEGLVATLMALGRAGELRRSDTRTAIEVLLKRGGHQAAYQLYALMQPPPHGVGSLNPDPGFDRPLAEYGADSVPFDWQLSPAAGTSVEVDGFSNTLVIGTNGQLARRAAYRYIPVKAGPYALSYRVKGDASGVALNVICATGGPFFGSSSPEEISLQEFQQRRFEFDVPAACPVVVVEFATLATGQPIEAEFDDVLVSAN